VKDDEIANGWRKYFDKLFNKESERIVIELDDSLMTPTSIFFREFKRGKKNSKNDENKALDLMTPQLRCKSLNYSLTFFSSIRCLMSTNEIYKYQSSRKNIQICTNYIGIKLESYHEALEENDRT
jgi:hypothetical protein